MSDPNKEVAGNKVVFPGAKLPVQKALETDPSQIEAEVRQRSLNEQASKEFLAELAEITAPYERGLRAVADNAYLHAALRRIVAPKRRWPPFSRNKTPDQFETTWQDEFSGLFPAGFGETQIYDSRLVLNKSGMDIPQLRSYRLKVAPKHQTYWYADLELIFGDDNRIIQLIQGLNEHHLKTIYYIRGIDPKGSKLIDFKSRFGTSSTLVILPKPAILIENPPSTFDFIPEQYQFHRQMTPQLSSQIMSRPGEGGHSLDENLSPEDFKDLVGETLRLLPAESQSK